MYYRKILVTGCAGDIAISVARILRDENVCECLYGCDISDDHPGKFFFDKCFVLPRADDKTYFSCLSNLVGNEGVELIIPCSEAELRLLAENEFFGKANWFLTANLFSMRVGFDKYLTNKILENKILPRPWTCLANENLPLEYPCILKSKYGCGSKRIVKINNVEEINNVSIYEDDIFQEFLPDEEEEYTCGVFRGTDKVVRTIILKRKLRGGLTGSGIVVHNMKIDGLLETLADLIDLNGSINVQLRMKNGLPMIFEINPRFSSTVGFRNKLGFKDLLWSIQNKKGIELDNFEKPVEGIKFYKVYEDIIIYS